MQKEEPKMDTAEGTLGEKIYWGPWKNPVPSKRLEPLTNEVKK